MRMLLVNQNPIVSRLVGLSAQKAGYEIDEVPSLESVEGDRYDLVLIDDAKLEGETPASIKEKTGAKKVCLIYAEEEKEGFDYSIKKPFLPTEMVDLMTEIKEELLLPELEETPTPELPESEEELLPEPDLALDEESDPLGEEDFDALLAELESDEEGSGEPPAEEAVEEGDLDALLEEIAPEADAGGEEESAEEDFDALLASLEEGSQEQPSDEEEAEAAGEGEVTPEPDLDALLEAVDLPEAFEASEEEHIGGEEESPEEDLDALLADLDLESKEEETEESTTMPEEGDEEPVSLPEPDEEVGGILDEELVSEVKELLDEEPSENEAESSSVLADSEEDLDLDLDLEDLLEESEEALPDGEEPREETMEAEEMPALEAADDEELIEEMALEEAAEPEENPMADESLPMEEKPEPQESEAEAQMPPQEHADAEEDEFEGLREEDLVAALGEASPDHDEESAQKSELCDTSEKAAPQPSVSQASQEEALISRMMGMDPEALRKLLAGAQITINITFPKEV